MPIARASFADSLGAVTGVMAPTIAKGVLIRRPKVVALSQMLALDGRAVRRMQKLRRKYGAGPLMLRAPGRARAILLEGSDVRRVIEGAPEPFAPASSEKRAALAHFEPRVALASHGAKREDRRRFNERVLETDNPVHRLAAAFIKAVDEEMTEVLRDATASGVLDWEAFFAGWYRLVRRVIFGRGARDDHELTDMLAELRSRGNWAFFQSKDEHLRSRFHERVEAHIERSDEDTLAAIIRATPKTPDTAPSHQVAQWLFAFDPGGMATFRALALLSTHPDAEARAREEIAAAAGETRPLLQYLRACLHESLRLWPTTPAILRETTRETDWDDGSMPAGTTIMIFAPFFHRDDERLDFANRFAPEIWLGNGPSEELPLVPFSGGPGICPARNFVPLIGSLVLARLLREHRFDYQARQELRADRPMPALLDNYRLRYGLQNAA